MASLFRNREEILADLESAITTRIPDVYLGDDGVLHIIFEVVSGVFESVFLANEILYEDMFILTANEDSLNRKGDELGVPRLPGTDSVGSLRFSGDGGTPVPISTEVAYDPQTGADYLYFVTTALGVIPNPGNAIAPLAAINVAAGNLNGLYEYVITFLTAAGETEPGAESIGVNPVAQKVDLTAIPLGGAGTTGRRIYRSKNGGAYGLVATLADNATTVFTDNVLDGAVGGSPPSISTAEAIDVTASSEDPGTDYNVGPGTITVLTDAPDGVTNVTNPAAFTGGTDPEAVEDFRDRLLEAERAPKTGSPADIKVWAEEISGVELATVFPNDNLGIPTNGHVTVRISGPGGTIPGSPVITAVLDTLNAKDMANATIHVATFTSTATNVSVTITPSVGYVLGDISASVSQAIANYINGLNVGETVRLAGIYAAVFNLPGVTDLVVTVPATNQATGATSKRVPGVITVT